MNNDNPYNRPARQETPEHAKVPVGSHDDNDGLDGYR